MDPLNVGHTESANAIGPIQLMAEAKLAMGNKWTSTIVKAFFQNLGSLVTGETKWKDVKFQAMISLANQIANVEGKVPGNILDDLKEASLNEPPSWTRHKGLDNPQKVSFEMASRGNSAIRIDQAELQGKTPEEIQDFAKRIKQNHPNLVAIDLRPDDFEEIPLNDDRTKSLFAEELSQAKTNGLFLKALCEEGCVPIEVSLGNSPIEEFALVTLLYHMQKNHGTEFSISGTEPPNEAKIISELRPPDGAEDKSSRSMNQYVGAARMMIFFEADKENFHPPQDAKTSGDVLNAIRNAKLPEREDQPALNVY